MERTGTKVPDCYHVVMHNDDFTPMDFVTMVLIRHFFHPASEAESLMMKIHRQGEAIAGTYPYDIAASKKRKVTDLARQNNFPLRLTLRPAE